MFAVTVQDVYIAADDIRLGGVYSPGLLGPTPEGLAHSMGAVPPANPPYDAGLNTQSRPADINT
jgi:hypothetical protein